MPSPRFDHGYKNDVFISYTHVDDEADPTGRKWVSKFEADLHTRVSHVSGHTVEIWRDPRLGKADRFDAEIADQIRQSAILLVVLSPSYFGSTYCRQERDEFRQVAPDIGNKARMIKVAKTYVDLSVYPEDLLSLNEYKFYTDERRGIYRELHLHEDPVIRGWYATRIDDVAQEVSTLLHLLEPAATPPAPATAVFLAEPSSDLEEPRNAIRRSLIQRGYEVLPKAPLRLLSAPELQSSLDADLARANLAIHPIGAHYGFIPELAGGASIVRIQLEHSARNQRNGGFCRLVWLPEGLEPDEEPERALIREIREKWAGNPFELIEASLQRFQTVLPDWLERPRPAGQAVKKRPSVYVLCAGDEDRKASRGVRAYLNSQNLEVGSATYSADKHIRRLAEDDAFLIYYGQCADDWVRDRVSEIAAPGPSGRKSPVFARAVFLADPPTDDKDDFLTNDAQVLKGYSPVPLDQALAPFLAGISASGGQP